MTLSASITAYLQSDYALMSILDGGVFDALEISRQLTPEAFDASGEILPCALVKTGSENALRNKISAVQTPVTVYLYQRAGYDVLEPALERVYALLNLRHEDGIWEIQFNNEIARTTDDALNCSLAVQRYNAVRRK